MNEEDKKLEGGGGVEEKKREVEEIVREVFDENRDIFHMFYLAGKLDQMRKRGETEEEDFDKHFSRMRERFLEKLFEIRKSELEK